MMDPNISTGSVLVGVGAHQLTINQFPSTVSGAAYFQIIEHTPVGGEFIPIDATAVLIAGAQSNALSILGAFVVIGAVAFGTLIISVKRKRN